MIFMVQAAMLITVKMHLNYALYLYMQHSQHYHNNDGAI